MKHFGPFFLTSLIVLACLRPVSIPAEEFQHEKIVLKGFDGNPLTIDSKAPYSPKKTCGACHDYEQITRGYHFQQGRTDRAGKIVISDTSNLKFPWNLSFTATGGDAKLDRTPPPGEPDGKSYGGYAGLSVRLVRELDGIRIVTSEGVAQLDGDRFRGKAIAMDPCS